LYENGILFSSFVKRTEEKIVKTKFLYRDCIWEVIAGHPSYSLGRRELVALQRFLPSVATHTPRELGVLHLASSTGREVPAIMAALPGTRTYLLDDIVVEVVERSRRQLQEQFPAVQFRSAVVDVELLGNITKLRRQLVQPTLLVLVGNGVIFSNRMMDINIHQAMGKDDLFMLTVEEPHSLMSGSYLIPPIFELLSESGRKVTKENIQVWYVKQTAEMHMACGGEDLLVSYKPTADQLRERMIHAGFAEVVFKRYEDLHMLAGLYLKRKG